MSRSPSRKRRYLSASKPVEVVEIEPSERHTHVPKRIVTVYDAVAGRASNAGFTPRSPLVSQTRDTASSSNTAAAPEEVLFRRKNAPARYEETDDYFANESLPPAQLPDSDLLKALHCYAADFYSRAVPACTHDWRSMDETALLSLGILMEELSEESLGTTGDLVFAEGDREGLAAAESGVGGVVERKRGRPRLGRPRKKIKRLDTDDEQAS